MKRMYIKLLATCCLVATMSHAAENQGRTYSEPARGQILRRHVSTIGTEKPAIFPHTDSHLFLHGKYSEKPYQKNTESHPALPHVPTINPHIPFELALLFAPTQFLAIKDAPATPKSSVTPPPPPSPAPDDISTLLSSASACSQFALLASPEASKHAADDGYASDASSVFEESKHVSATTLSGSRFALLAQRGYGYAYSVAAALAAKKESIPAIGKRAKFSDKSTELNAALSDLANATPAQADIVIQYAAQQKPGIVDRNNLSSARDYAKKMELTILAEIDPAIQAARAQAARVKTAQEQLAKEEAALKAAQEKILTQVPKAKDRAGITNTVLRMMGTDIPETPTISTDLAAHESIAADIQARKAALLKKQVLSVSTTSAPEKAV